LRAEVEKELDLMTAVSTGGPAIQSVNSQYRKDRQTIRKLLQELGLQDPNPYPDLWVWYGKWSRDLPTYASRRTYLRELYAPLFAAIDELESAPIGSGLPESEQTGWAAVDGQAAQLRLRLAAASTSEDAQAVGLLCRDLMITLADAAHDESVHGDVGESAVDRLNAVVDREASGAENQKLRRLLKATIDYANVVQHRRKVSMLEAGLVAEATMAAVNLIRRVVEE
jgi:hypothetical protein